MPLLKRKRFPLVDPPKDLEPHELVFQVRFTKEIFRDYHQYLNQINRYHRRIWMCKVTGKSNLTYEEALVSERRATEKVQQFPKELMAPALRVIQYSTLSLKDLADAIAAKLQECLFVGGEFYGRKDNRVYPCKIIRVLEGGDDKVRYEVAWLDRNKQVIENALVNAGDLIQRKLPYSRSILKSFIRESTYRSSPWVLHEKLAQSHGISTDLPKELKGKAFFREGLLICNKRRKKKDEVRDLDVESKQPGKAKRKMVMLDGTTTEDDQLGEEPIKYPIDDLLVQCGVEDRMLATRPPLSREFNVPIDCVGELLMVWDLCSSYGRLLHLWPFSLEDFANAICHKDSNLNLLVECHSALLTMLLKDDGEYFLAAQKKKRKFKITLLNWAEYLCDFLEMVNISELVGNTTMIKRGHYCLLDAHAKLGILWELVNHVLESNIFRQKLDEFIQQRQVLGATRRGEALKEARRKREEKELLKSASAANGIMNDHGRQNGEVEKNRNLERTSPKSESEQSYDILKKIPKKRNDVVRLPTDDDKDELRKEIKDNEEGVPSRSSKEQRKEYYEREMEKRVIRTNPLGKDRDYNRYWWFRHDGRIFVESSDSKQWGYYCTVEELDALKGSLNCKGERERALKKQLEKFYSRICVKLQKRSESSNRVALEDAVLRRSTRVRASPRENSASFLKYVNKWKE